MRKEDVFVVYEIQINIDEFTWLHETVTVLLLTVNYILDKNLHFNRTFFRFFQTVSGFQIFLDVPVVYISVWLATFSE